MARYDVVGLGACLVDYIARVPKIIGAEEKINVKSVYHECGGPTTNNLIQASRLGLKAAWMGKIGDDVNGRIILSTFSKEGMDKSFIRVVEGAESSYTWLPVDDKGNRSIYMFSNITRTITPQEVREYFTEAIGEARAFHSEICQIPLDAVLEGLSIARAHGVKTFVDLDVDTGILINNSKLGSKKQLEEILASTYVLKAGGQVAMDYSGQKTIKKTIDFLLAKGPKMVAITLGSKGCALATKEEYLELPTPYVPVVDSTGAGDAFMGGLSYGVLQGNWSLEKTGSLANACGAYCCMRLGAQQSGNYDELLKQFGSDAIWMRK